MAKTIKNTRLILVIILLIASLIRFWKLSKVPVSLFGDELDVGYHAYSILKTGRDYSGNFLPLHFHSLAEWRTPLYLYSCVPTVALFGISPLGVRLPAALFGILGVYGIYLLVKRLTKDETLALISTFTLAISPWHIQYSRAGFEVTQLLTFLVFGLYFFFRSLGHPGDRRSIGSRNEQKDSIASLQNDKKDDKYLWISVVLLVLTPWIYSTAKLFTPFLLLTLFIVWKKDILRLPVKEKVKSILVGLVVGLPIVYSILFGGGTQRFGYISVFTDPTRETEIGYAREFDAGVRGEVEVGLQPTLTDKLFHNKITFWGKQIISNYLKAFSTDFLFINGDPNLRHSITGIGQFYKIEAAALLLGLILFYSSSEISQKTKLLISFWVLVGVVPSVITRGGGNHATRLILILPPLIILISYGVVRFIRILKGRTRFLAFATYYLLLATCFVFYQHNFWVHNPWNSEHWWHYGWKESIQSIKEIENNYQNIVISMAGEPAWIFFAANYQYPPDLWQKYFPIGNDVELSGFGKVSHIDKFYFGSPQVDGGFYDWGKVINNKTLYLANASEVNVNLIREPERTPPNLRLIKSTSYPSGEPAFYLFTGASNESDSD